MVEFFKLLASADGLSGRAVRGAAAPPMSPEGVANATLPHLEESVHSAARDIVNGLDLASRAIGQAVDVASDKAFAGAAKVATMAQGNGHHWPEHLQLGRLYPGAGHPRRSAWSLVVRHMGLAEIRQVQFFAAARRIAKGRPGYGGPVAAWAPQGSYGGTILE